MFGALFITPVIEQGIRKYGVVVFAAIIDQEAFLFRYKNAMKGVKASMQL